MRGPGVRPREPLSARCVRDACETRAPRCPSRTARHWTASAVRRQSRRVRPRCGLTRNRGRQQRDRRDERLRQCRSDGGEQASDGCLGDMQAMPGPFDPICKKFRAYEDYREAEGQDDRVDCQDFSSERTAFEDRVAGSRFPVKSEKVKTWESGKDRPDAAKPANDAYNICSGHRRERDFAIRPQAERQCSGGMADVG